MNIERIRYLENLIKESEDDAFPFYALGMEYLNTNQEKSLDYFFKVYSKFKDYLPVYYQLGTLLGDTDEEKAIEILSEGIKLAKEQNNPKTKRELEQLLENISF